jgi:hypothetical protein
MNGVVRMPSGDWLSEKALWPEYQQVALLVKINGGNRKRGLLAWGRLLGEFAAKATERHA